MKRWVFVVAMALLMGGVFAASARAATSYWIGASAAITTYTNQNNWLGGVLPGDADTVIYTNTYRVSANDLRIVMTSPITNAVVVTDYPQHPGRVMAFSNVDWWVSSRFALDPSVAGRTNSVRLMSGTLTVTNASRSASVVVGNGIGVAIFDIAAGAVVNVDHFYLTNALSYVGANNFPLNGDLNIFSASSVVMANESFTNSSGDWGISGHFNLWGGTTTVAQVAGRGISVNSGATVRVSGAGAMLNASGVRLGSPAGSADSVLWVENGGVANVASLMVGSNATRNLFSVVPLGSGSVVVTNGGVLRGTDRISTGTNGMGIISVVLSTVEFTTNTPNIDLQTAGSFTMASSTLAFRGVTNANFFSSRVTNIVFSGSNTLSLRAATNAMLGTYTFKTNNGQGFAFLDLQGGLFQATNLLVGTGGKITGNGVVGSINVTNQGTISPGNSPGLLTFASNLTLTSDSVLAMEIAGTNLSLFDRLVVSGALARAGSVQVTLLSYAPLAGDSFDLVDWGVASGGFSLLNLPSLSGGLQWDTNQFDTQGVLMVVSAIPEPRGGLVLAGALALLALAKGRRRAA